MSKFFSVPGMSPSGGEGKMGVRGWVAPPEPTKEQLQERFKPYYDSRGETLDASFADVGDQYRFRGDEAKVLHVEKNADKSQDVYLQRSSQTDSGTYLMKVAPDANRKLVPSKVKRTFE